MATLCGVGTEAAFSSGRLCSLAFAFRAMCVVVEGLSKT
jgi:hypothetical protein